MNKGERLESIFTELQRISGLDHQSLSSAATCFCSASQETGITPTFWENSEVSPIDVPFAVPLVFVAVALTGCPACGTGLTQEKLPFPLALVVTVVSCPASVAPSPWPEGSGAATKHWTVKDWEGLLFSVPEMVVRKGLVELFTAEVMTGKFWRWLLEAGRWRRDRHHRWP